MAPPIEYNLGFFFSDDRRRVVLTRKFRPAWHRGYFNGVGGKLLEDEDLLVSMVREFREETGLATMAGDWRYFARLEVKRPEPSIVHILDAHGPRIDDACTQITQPVAVYFCRKLPERTLPSVRWMIPLALDPGIVRFHYLYSEHAS